ncbi:hypothetical protein ACFSTE_19210 [Aquimarina hainanensis]|uniref:Outer membrane protein beta-barrel domain-containing protein n=1 Tax=Aquimarina hainanensis TaxID=1578017 RepID=A0ABW5NCK8_9FLAO|nr:hypothetical protein [Aquimarina sp. TRL1]QKX06545.1 hypothetical protein HN014_17040 [Aquimarina sp. TRL1]
MALRFLYSFFALFSATVIYAQNIPNHSLGIRLSGGTDLWTEVSYQKSTTQSNRIQADIGIQNKNAFDTFKLNGTYHWIFNLPNNFAWYVGPGAGITFVDHSVLDIDTDVFLFFNGDLGIEYYFDFPIQLAANFKPEIYFKEYDHDNIIFNIGLSVRYVF